MFWRIIHKYLALIVFSQLMVWLATGFLLGQAEHSKPLSRIASDAIAGSVLTPNLISVENVLIRSPNALSIELLSLLGNPTYKVMTHYARHAHEREYELIDAIKGNKIELTANDIRDLVNNQFRLTSPIQDLRRVDPPIEHLPKEQQSVWHVRLSDRETTHIYVRASTGELAGVVDSNREWTNLLMLLHFMDYQNTGSFNHWWIKALALLTVLLSISGITWLVLVVRDQQGYLQNVVAKDNESLLDCLQHNALSIGSVCGGGGTCGQCIVRLDPSAAISVAERYRLSQDRLLSGYRLACQQNTDLKGNVQLVESPNPKTVSCELLSNTFITPFIKELRFKYQGSVPLDFKPGSFVQFTIKEGQSLAFPKDLPRRYQPYWPRFESATFSHPNTVRHYSVANRNDGSGVLTFNIKMQPAQSNNQRPGIGSFHLGNLSIGTVVDIVAGIAPLKALIDELIFGLHSTLPITLFYGAKHPVELANHCWLKAVETQHSNFTYQPIVSNASSIWCGPVGRVQIPLAVFLDTHRDLHRCLFFLCGPPAMMNDVTQLLLRYSVNENAIQIDSFSPFTTT